MKHAMINNTYQYFPNEVNTSAHDPKTQFFYNNKILKIFKKIKESLNYLTILVGFRVRGVSLYRFQHELSYPAQKSTT